MGERLSGFGLCRYTVEVRYMEEGQNYTTVLTNIKATSVAKAKEQAYDLMGLTKADVMFSFAALTPSS